MVPYNPQQNGVAKRKNRSMLEAVRAMLYGQDMPHYLWAEACSTIVYIQNSIPHKAIGKMTLQDWKDDTTGSVHLEEAKCQSLKDIW